MVRKRAFIHVGMPKTGTSAIQMMLADHGDELKAAGLYHPDTLDGNRPALMTLFPQGGKRHYYLRQKNISEQEGRTLAESLWTQIGAVAGQYDLVLSSEFLFDIGKHAGKMVTAFGSLGFDVVFVCYLRHPVNAAISSAQQSIKMRQRSLAEVCREPRWHRAMKTLAPLVDTVGRDWVIVADFDAARAEGAAQHFLNAIGYGSIRVPMVKANESLTMDGAIYADWHSRETEKRGKPPFKRKLIFELGGSKFTLPEATLQQVRDIAREEVDWVAREFGIHLCEQVSGAIFRNEPSPESRRLIEQQAAGK